MSLRYALLGLLARECLTGYDLTKRFDSSVGFFWSAKHSQIYPELATLSKEGLVTFEVVTQTSKPNKKVYTITDAGREALAEWVATPREKRSVKDPLLMRVWAVGTIEPDGTLAQLRDTLDEYEQRLAMFRAFESEAPPDHLAIAPDNPWLGAFLALRAGQMQAEAYRDWLKWTIAQMEQVVAEREQKAATAS